MSADNLPICVNINALTEYFSCPVCMCELRETSMTHCGHRFCTKCIQECIDRHHKCPCCNKRARQEELIRDCTFDQLIRAFNQEKELGEKKYFDELLKKAASDVTEVGEEETSSEISPVQDVLKKHLKDSFIPHERYKLELYNDVMRRKAEIEKEAASLIADLQSQPLEEEEMSRQIDDIEQSCQRQLGHVDADATKCVKLVAEAYDRYLTEHIPSLSVLPVKVSVTLLDKSIKIPDLTLKPVDGLDHIKTHICQQMEARGDNVVKFGDDVTFIAFGPFAKKTPYEMRIAAREVVANGSSQPDIHVLPPDCRPLVQFSLKPGTEIVLHGGVQCESDLPKQCFAKTFDKQQPKAVDYFSCKDCNFNWVCRPCMEVCHKSHTVVPYIMNHQPTWACCYCPKKKKCQVQ